MQKLCWVLAGMFGVGATIAFSYQVPVIPGVCLGMAVLTIAISQAMQHPQNQTRRAEELQEFAQQFDLIFTAEPSPELTDSLQRFPLMNWGQRQSINCCLKGTIEGQSFILFDLTCTFYVGERSGTESQTVILFSPEENLPAFRKNY